MLVWNRRKGIIMEPTQKTILNTTEEREKDGVSSGNQTSDSPSGRQTRSRRETLQENGFNLEYTMSLLDNIVRADDPPYLTVGTEVSAKYKGAFCEAKVRKVSRSVKVRVLYKSGAGSVTVLDDQIRGTLRVGATCEVKQPDKKEYLEATITKIQDCSQYTVVFDDGDITTLRRTALCLKSGRHFAESETLDRLPLTHPEHFGSPVVNSRKGRRSRHNQDNLSDEEEAAAKAKRKEEKEPDIGKVVCVELGDKKKQKDNWFPGLVVAPTAQETVRIHVKEEYLVRSFKDGRYFTVPKKEATEFTREIAAKVDNNTLKTAVEKALMYLDKDELPPHWDRDLLFGPSESSSDSESGSDSDSSDDEPREEKDHFVAQLYKFMDDSGTPINKGPTILNRDVDLYKLFKVVHKLGGSNRVSNHNQWKTIAHKLGFGPSVSSLVKVCYKKFLSSFEEFYRKLGCTMVNHPRGHRARHRGGRSLIRDRDRTSSTPSSTGKEKDKIPAAATPSTSTVQQEPVKNEKESQIDNEETASKNKEPKKDRTKSEDSATKKVDLVDKSKVKTEEKQKKKETVEKEEKLKEKEDKSKPSKEIKKEEEKPKLSKDTKKEEEKSRPVKEVKKEEEKLRPVKELKKEEEKSKSAKEIKKEDEKSKSVKETKKDEEKSKTAKDIKKEEEKSKSAKDIKKEEEKSKSVKEIKKEEKSKSAKETKKDEEKLKSAVEIKKEEEKSKNTKDSKKEDDKSKLLKDSKKDEKSKTPKDSKKEEEKLKTAKDTKKEEEKLKSPKDTKKVEEKAKTTKESKKQEEEKLKSVKDSKKEDEKTKIIKDKDKDKKVDKLKVPKEKEVKTKKEEKDNNRPLMRSYSRKDMTSKTESTETVTKHVENKNTDIDANTCTKENKNKPKEVRQKRDERSKSASEKVKAKEELDTTKEDEESAPRIKQKEESKLPRKDSYTADKKPKESKTTVTESTEKKVAQVKTSLVEDEKKKSRKRKETDERSSSSEGKLEVLPDHVNVMIGDKLKVFYGPIQEAKVIYEAKVVQSEEENGEPIYLVHYTGWNTRYDEWIKRGRIAENLSWTPSRGKRLKHPRKCLKTEEKPSLEKDTTPSNERLTQSNEKPSQPTEKQSDEKGMTTRRSRSSFLSRSLSRDTPSTPRRSTTPMSNASSSGRSLRQVSTRVLRRRRTSTLTDNFDAFDTDSDRDSDFEAEDELEKIVAKNKKSKPRSPPKKKPIKPADPEDEDNSVLNICEDTVDNNSDGDGDGDDEDDEEISKQESEKSVKSDTDVKVEIKEEAEPQGREFDLNQIRSELKGIEKADIMSDTELNRFIPDEEDESHIISYLSRIHSTRGLNSGCGSKETVKQPVKDDIDDVYEFREPEPFKFEVRGKRSGLRIFDEAEKDRTKIAKLAIDEIPSYEFETKKFKSVAEKKVELEENNTEKASTSLGSSSSSCEDAFDKLRASPSYHSIVESKISNILSPRSLSSMSGFDRLNSLELFEDDQDDEDDDADDKLVISESEEIDEPLFTYPKVLPNFDSDLTDSSLLSGNINISTGSSQLISISHENLLSTLDRMQESCLAGKSGEELKSSGLVLKSDDDQDEAMSDSDDISAEQEEIMTFILEASDKDDKNKYEDDPISAAIQRVMEQAGTEDYSNDMDIFCDPSSRDQNSPIIMKLDLSNQCSSDGGKSVPTFVQGVDGNSDLLILKMSDDESDEEGFVTGKFSTSKLEIDESNESSFFEKNASEVGDSNISCDITDVVEDSDDIKEITEESESRNFDDIADCSKDKDITESETEEKTEDKSSSESEETIEDKTDSENEEVKEDYEIKIKDIHSSSDELSENTKQSTSESETEKERKLSPSNKADIKQFTEKVQNRKDLSDTNVEKDMKTKLSPSERINEKQLNKVSSDNCEMSSKEKEQLKSTTETEHSKDTYKEKLKDTESKEVASELFNEKCEIEISHEVNNSEEEPTEEIIETENINKEIKEDNCSDTDEGESSGNKDNKITENVENRLSIVNDEQNIKSSNELEIVKNNMEEKNLLAEEKMEVDEDKESDISEHKSVKEVEESNKTEMEKTQVAKNSISQDNFVENWTCALRIEKPSESEDIKEIEREEEIERNEEEKEKAIPEEDADASLQSLLCEETIPGSPTPLTEEQELENEQQRILEMPFASVPGSNCHRSPLHPVASQSTSTSVGMSHPSPIRITKKSSNEAATVIDNTPPTTPDSITSSISASPTRDRDDSTVSKTHRNSFEIDLEDNRFSEEDSLLNAEVSTISESRSSHKKPSANDGERENLSPQKKRRKTMKRQDSESSCKRPKHSSGRSPRNGGSDSDEFSEHSVAGYAPLCSTDNTSSSRSPRPSRYNFYVELDPDLDASQRIALLQQKLQELRKTYMNVKAELACIDRRRKKLRRREKEEKAMKQEVACM